MKITFILRNGTTIDSIIPEEERKNFNFGVMCGAMRMNGYFQNGNMHLQYVDVCGMLLVTDEVPPPAIKPFEGILQ